jgi:cell division protein FtsW
VSVDARVVGRASPRPFGGLLGVDVPLLVCVSALVVFGLNMVYSASYVMARNTPEFGSDTYFLTRQALWAGIGFLALICMAAIDYRRLRVLALPALALTVVLLVAVVVSTLGRSAYGAQRWLAIGGLPAVQPAELVKLSLVLFFATWLSSRGERLRQFRSGPLPFALVLVLVSGLVMAQPDFGSGFVVIAIAATMFFVAGARMLHLLGGIAVGGVALLLFAMSAGYRVARLTAFLNPGSDLFGANWHATQASIALGSGGAFGRGLGASRQKFFWLSSAHADSIFAVIGEELGLVGTLIVLGAFLFIAYRGYRIALDAPDTMGALLATGITAWLSFQAIINIGVATNSLPVTGVPLPFVSFGGSSLVSSMAGVGLLLSVARRRIPPGDATRSTRPQPSNAEARR